ncbi:hypothetical protein VTL71DRAFT_12055 [Oculimacula yallundae]|uniref:BTB domain-containing protein n=1 Tax=Oculimacula yallundae TaxID=86028 RepID=A0ABR4CSG4_9HELO
MFSSASKLLGDLGHETVTIHVGPEGKSTKFTIHKKLICDKVDFFRKAFTGGFKENDGTMKLPDDDPAIFSVFLYSFAEKICLGGLADQTMDAIRKSAWEDQDNIWISFALAASIYRSTNPGSPLRLYCIKEITNRLWDGEWGRTVPRADQLLDMHNHWHDQEDLFHDFYSFLGKNSVTLEAPWPDLEKYGVFACCFHSHGDNEACGAS